MTLQFLTSVMHHSIQLASSVNTDAGIVRPAGQLRVYVIWNQPNRSVIVAGDRLWCRLQVPVGKL